MKHQTVTMCRGGEIEHLRLPAPHIQVVPGVFWGRFEDFFTPAFWVSREWIDGGSETLSNYSLGKSLREEIAACLLGGHGMPAEVGVAAFHRLRDRKLLDGNAGQNSLEAALREPLLISGRLVKYRFPRTKAKFLSLALNRLDVEEPPTSSGVQLRDWLLTFAGIGPKTASWIARNALHSDEVAILDVHLIRAGILMGLFQTDYCLQKDYFRMETQLMGFAKAVGIRLSRLDNLVWYYMRRLNALAIEAIAGIQVPIEGDPS